MALGQFCAIEFIHEEGDRKGTRELAAVQAFKRAAVASPHLIPVEHIGVREQVLFYVMPLADGTPDRQPGDPEWQPVTLGDRIRQRRDARTWFSAAEVRGWMVTLADAVEALDAAGLVHRDIKPDNILFIRERLVLSDISLLREDAAEMTTLGTPG